jgi:ribose-phosphate pyrophosphokinase
MILGGKGIKRFLEKNLEKNAWLCPFKSNFDDGEIALDYINSEIKILVQSCYPEPDKRILELLFMAKLAKEPIRALVPYVAYSRQDIFQEILTIIASNNIKELVTVDLHDNGNILPPWMVNLETTNLLLDISDKYELLVAPDRGARIRVEKLAALTGHKKVFLEKKRNLQGKIEISCLKDYNIRDKTCLILDDILATGDTISQATFTLLKKGAKSVSVFVTHSLFNKINLVKIANLPLTDFYTSDTISYSKLPSFVKIISLYPLLKNYLAIKS